MEANRKNRFYVSRKIYSHLSYSGIDGELGNSLNNRRQAKINIVNGLKGVASDFCSSVIDPIALSIGPGNQKRKR